MDSAKFLKHFETVKTSLNSQSKVNITSLIFYQIFIRG